MNRIFRTFCAIPLLLAVLVAVPPSATAAVLRDKEARARTFANAWDTCMVMQFYNANRAKVLKGMPRIAAHIQVFDCIPYASNTIVCHIGRPVWPNKSGGSCTAKFHLNSRDVGDYIPSYACTVRIVWIKRSNFRRAEPLSRVVKCRPAGDIS